ncbi:hypothetical protein [Phytomonospora endophytica]|uniref:Uncharacterized protein n=1 Tax=Phytomonospora endophytica TaxID=714109 RepID=A0A841FRV8_9ACTN|nr:hypothetical protein [Phytomonospora endophytica]MBB6038985.1 hypothetical protein [Phytomonospora endophytica]GIG67911.1 hypothetical protein Pen01_42060 [Phytomonospora endophytica]
MLASEPLLPEPVRGIVGPVLVGALVAFTLAGALFMVIWPKKMSAYRPGGPGPIRLRILGIVGLLIFAALGWGYFFGG